jgi:thioesterase domain-containing protein
MHGVASDIVLLKSGRKGPPLLCVHAGNFACMAALLNVDHAIYGLTAGNLEQADPDLSIEDLAVTYLEALAKVQPTGPFMLLGYSIGGLIAYEMAGILKQRGEEIALVALFDAPHPKFRQQLSSGELEVVRKTYLADRKRKYLKHVLAGRFDRLIADASRFAWGRLKPVAWKTRTAVRRALRMRPSAGSESMRSAAMWHAYSPRPLPARLILFRAEGREPEFADDPTMGWRKSAAEVDVQFATGIHEEMMAMPHAQRLAEQVKRYVDTAAVPRAG